MASHDVELASRDFTTGNAPLDNQSAAFSISGDGRYVGFTSESDSLLAPGLDTGQEDIFVYDRVTQAITRVSEAYRRRQRRTTRATSTAAIARNGRYVAFQSSALEPDVRSRSRTRLPGHLRPRSGHEHDRAVSVSWDGTVGGAAGNSEEPTISDDGRFVVFTTTAKNLLPPGAADRRRRRPGRPRPLRRGRRRRCVRARRTPSWCRRTATAASPATSYFAISGDGRYVAYASSSFLEPPYRYDLLTGETSERIDVAYDGGPADGTRAVRGRPVVRRPLRPLQQQRVEPAVARQGHERPGRRVRARHGARRHRARERQDRTARRTRRVRRVHDGHAGALVGRPLRRLPSRRTGRARARAAAGAGRTLRARPGERRDRARRRPRRRLARRRLRLLLLLRARRATGRASRS